MSRFALDQAWEADGDSDGFYTLAGGGNWADVEGFANEWLAIAVAIRQRKYESFSRCAFRPSPNGGGELWSPRNACSPRDRANVAESELDELADMIVATLRAAGAKCVAELLDPVPTGAFI